MPNPASSIRDTQEQAAQHAALGVLCPPCPLAAKSPFDGLPRWPEATHTMLAGAHQARPDDENDDDGKFADKPRAGNKSKNDDEDDGDEDRPRPKKRSPASSGAGAAAAGAGIGIGMILLIVGGIGACCLCVPGILVALMFPAIQKVRDAAANAEALNNARQIALGCHSHNDRWKSLPSPRMQPQPPQNQSPELSWRVSILPFVGQDPLFNQFNKGQAWNGPENQRHVNRMPMIYNNPSEAGGPNSSQTKFQYFTGPNTLFPDPLRKVNLIEIMDGTSNTFLFAEAATPVTWSQPVDMVVGNGPLPLPANRFIAAMADGTARIVNRRSASDDVLRQVINPSDGKFGPPGWGE